MSDVTMIDERDRAVAGEIRGTEDFGGDDLFRTATGTPRPRRRRLQRAASAVHARGDRASNGYCDVARSAA